MSQSTHATTATAPAASARPALALLAWLVVAALVAAAGLMSRDRPYVPLLSIATGVAALVLAYRRSRSFRAFALGLDLRWVLAFHALRAPIGVAFLWLMAAGSLTPEFARLAGWGDIAAGLGAALLVPFAARGTRASRRFLVTWNVFGLVDIALVALTAQRIVLFRGDVEAMRALFTFPGPLLPFFVVPLVIATHWLVFQRLRSAA